MTVIMTDMVIRASGNLSRYFYLLLLLVFVNCNSQDNKKAELQIGLNQQQNDSLELTMKNVPAGRTSEFIYMDENSNTAYVRFENKTKKEQNITAKMPKMGTADFVLMYGCWFVINGKSGDYEHKYYIKNDVNAIDFENDTCDVLLKSDDERVIILDDIYEQYANVYKKNYFAKNVSEAAKIKTFENLYEKNRKIFSQTANKVKLDINELEFLNRLSVIKGNDKRIEKYLEQMQNPIWSGTLTELFYGYLESIKDSISQIDLTDSNLSDSFKQILPIHVNRHLQYHKEKKYPSYEKNVQWLTKTEYYKKNKAKIDIDLKPENKDLNIVAKELTSFSVYDKLNNKLNLENIIQQNKAEYYLFDFWASWCVPCIRDSKLIHEMSLPKNLTIINISLDKTKDREKWKNKAKELMIEDSYLFVEDNHNKDFINLIKLNQIPRYILTNKDFKILDIDMISPSQGDFKKEIQTLIEKHLQNKSNKK